MILPYQFDSPVAVIGDIHGRADLLEELLLRIGPLPIVVLGDLCDRGPDTQEVLDLLIERKAIGVMGNHEEWFHQWAAKGEFDEFALSKVMGGRATLESYGVGELLGVFQKEFTTYDIRQQYLKVPREHLDFLKSLAMVIDLKVMDQSYYVVHAGIPNNDTVKALPENKRVEHSLKFYREALLWGYNRPDKQPMTDRTLLMGHLTQGSKPLDIGHIIALDTGSGYPGGKLSCVILPERRFITVG